MVLALFAPEGNTFVPTDVTRGGWSDDAQHGSPPAGLLARAIEAVPTAAPMQVVRFTVDLFRPVPLVPLVVEVEVVRDGRRIQLVDGHLSAEGTAVGRAVALKIRRQPVDIPPTSSDGLEPGPEELETLVWGDVFGSKELPRFHTDGVEVRTIDRSFMKLGPGRSWFRLRQPVVAGESVTPFVLAATLADMANGNSHSLDPHTFLYVNPDITLYLHRLPEGEWLGMESSAHQHSHGVGMADTVLYDRAGPIGRVAQAQILEAH